jgi:hypothetical protein
LQHWPLLLEKRLPLHAVLAVLAEQQGLRVLLEHRLLLLARLELCKQLVELAELLVLAAQAVLQALLLEAVFYKQQAVLVEQALAQMETAATVPCELLVAPGALATVLMAEGAEAEQASVLGAQAAMPVYPETLHHFQIMAQVGAAEEPTY